MMILHPYYVFYIPKSILVLYFNILVHVTCLEWFNEDHQFAVGYSDGHIYLASRHDIDAPVIIEAHQVSVIYSLLQKNIVK